MADMFVTTGMTILTIVTIVLTVISLLFMGALLYEYRYIHGKRLELMQVLGRNIGRDIRQQNILMGVYVAVTLLITVLSLFLFFTQPHIL